MLEKSEQGISNKKQGIPNNTPVFVLGSVKQKYGVVLSFNGYVYMIEFDDGEVIERTEEYLVRVPRTRSKT